MNDSIEDIITNLNVLSNLEQSKKLVTKDVYLNIEQDTIIPEFIKRWLRGDSRDNTIKKINSVIEESISQLDNYPELYDYLQNAKKGINNLKETYSTCSQTKARLDTIIFKINKLSENTEHNKII